MTKNITTLINGAGAVENAWEPILESIKKVEKQIVNKDVANQYFAFMVYDAKFSSSESDDPSVILKNFSDFKSAIARSLQEGESNGNMRVRPEFNSIFDTFIPKSDCFIHINTNWDSVVDFAIAKIVGRPVKSIHIHGESKHPETLYLPSEVFFESYRNGKEKNYLGQKHAQAAHCIGASKKIIIYGLSIDPLDAELQVLFSRAVSEELKEIIIINLEEEHQKIAARLRMLLPPEFTIKIIAYKPDNLNKAYEF